MGACALTADEVVVRQAGSLNITTRTARGTARLLQPAGRHPAAAEKDSMTAAESARSSHRRDVEAYSLDALGA
jgi:hypothetical protein